MNKIFLIIKREYLTRVKKRSFIVMTLLAPVLMAALMVIPIVIATMGDKEDKRIAVIDQSTMFGNVLKNTEHMKFEFITKSSVAQMKDSLVKQGYYALLVIPDSVDFRKIQMFSEKQPTMDVKSHISNAIEKEVERKKLKEKGINLSFLDSIKPDVKIETIKLKKGGKEEKSSTEIAMAIGFIGAFLIYMFVFVYGAQVMRGVIEEKTSRIVEVMISSVKPFQLMMGKIVGIAMVALTQFVLWIVLTMAIFTTVQTLVMPKDFASRQQEITKNLGQNATMEQVKSIENEDSVEVIFAYIQNLHWGLIIFCFVFYFIGGYLLYASLFAAIGSAVDSESDTQQFMLPISLPLILAFVMAQSIIQNPEGAVAFWFSMIPFTSPIIMLVRLPFDVPMWQLALSMGLLVLTFIGSTWMAAKIYRTGILMYGKKVNYKELWKWLRYH